MSKNSRIRKIFKDDPVIREYLLDEGKRWLRFVPSELKHIVNEFHNTMFLIPSV